MDNSRRPIPCNKEYSLNCVPWITKWPIAFTGIGSNAYMKYYKKILREKSKYPLEENGTNQYKKNGDLGFGEK